MTDVTFDMSANHMEVHHQRAEPWKITLVDTGDNSMTGGRLKRVYEHIKDEDAFCFTYGDGVSDVNIAETISFHKKHGKLATLTSTFPPGRFGVLEISNNEVKSFKEKPKGDFINGGFFVLSPKVISRIDNDETIWEQQPLMSLAEDGQLMAYHHDGFWQPMDTLRDKIYLEELWSTKNAPWKSWE
jgi:glucose-1-phosphate cytidylyltransferase